MYMFDAFHMGIMSLFQNNDIPLNTTRNMKDVLSIYPVTNSNCIQIVIEW